MSHHRVLVRLQARNVRGTYFADERLYHADVGQEPWTEKSATRKAADKDANRLDRAWTRHVKGLAPDTVGMEPSAGKPNPRLRVYGPRAWARAAAADLLKMSREKAKGKAKANPLAQPMPDPRTYEAFERPRFTTGKTTPGAITLPNGNVWNPAARGRGVAVADFSTDELAGAK